MPHPLLPPCLFPHFLLTFLSEVGLRKSESDKLGNLLNFSFLRWALSDFLSKDASRKFITAGNSERLTFCSHATTTSSFKQFSVIEALALKLKKKNHDNKLNFLQGKVAGLCQWVMEPQQGEENFDRETTLNPWEENLNPYRVEKFPISKQLLFRDWRWD